MKKLIVFFMVAVLSLTVHAKSLRELFVAMPDSVLPTLSANLRLELVELSEMVVRAEAKSLLGSDCVLDTITSNYLQLSTSKAALVQMRLLPQTEGDSILCVVKTFSATEKESDVRFYDEGWRELDRNRMFAGVNLDTMASNLMAKPDTMSMERYQELVAMVEPKMCSAQLDSRENTIVFQFSLPLVSDEEKMCLNVCLLQRKFKWGGKIFNEY